MKKYIYKLALSFAALSLVMSCEDDDSSTVDPLPSTNVAITVSSMENNVTVMESAIAGGMASYTITATIDQPQVLHYIINLEQTGGTATAGVDFDTHQMIISPGDTSTSTTIDVYSTGDIETDETFTVSASVGEPAYSRLASPFNFNGTISDDYVNDVLDLTLAWDAEFVDGDVTIASTCDIDYDLLLADGVGNVLGYIAGSSDCPEVGTLSGLADGTYFLLADLYDNPLSGLGFSDTIPLTLEYSQEYFETSGKISNGNHTLNMAGATDQSVLAGLALVEVSGYNYTVTGL